MSDYKDIDRCIDALHAVKLTQSYYASSEKSAEMISEIVTMLGGTEDKGYATPPLKLSIARAIHESVFGKLPS
jgi:hypothetical protein